MTISHSDNINNMSHITVPTISLEKKDSAFPTGECFARFSDWKYPKKGVFIHANQSGIPSIGYYAKKLTNDACRQAMNP